MVEFDNIDLISYLMLSSNDTNQLLYPGSRLRKVPGVAQGVCVFVLECRKNKAFKTVRKPFKGAHMTFL